MRPKWWARPEGRGRNRGHLIKAEAKTSHTNMRKRSSKKDVEKNIAGGLRRVHISSWDEAKTLASPNVP